MKGGFVSNSNHGIMAVASSLDHGMVQPHCWQFCWIWLRRIAQVAAEPNVPHNCVLPILDDLIWANGDAMTTITIPISDDRLAQLQLHARQAGLSPEEFLRRQVEQLLEQPKASFEAAANYVLEKNSELYRRLS
jgi:hypothetical protein